MLNSVPETRASKTGPGYDPVHYAGLAAIEDFLITKSVRPGYRVLEVARGTGNVLGALESACGRGSVVGMHRFLEGLPVANARGRKRLLLRPPFRRVGRWSESAELADLHRRYEKKELAAKPVTAGFQNIFVSPFMMAIMPIVWLDSKCQAARLSGQSDSAGYIETRLLPILNGVQRRVLAQEVGLVLRKTRLPFGTSLIAFARKP